MSRALPDFLCYGIFYFSFLLNNFSHYLGMASPSVLPGNRLLIQNVFLIITVIKDKQKIPYTKNRGDSRH